MKTLEIWNCNSLWNFHTVFPVSVTISSSIQKTQKEEYWLPSETSCCLNISIWKGCFLKKIKKGKTHTSIVAVKHVMKHIWQIILQHRGYFGLLELDYLHISLTNLVSSFKWIITIVLLLYHFFKGRLDSLWKA